MRRKVSIAFTSPSLWLTSDQRKCESQEGTERTKRARIGTGVTTPINRYHPAIVAQAFATMATLHPGRVYLGLGTGEAMNEVPVGQRWPPFSERIERVEESIKIIRMLWSNGSISFTGKHFSITDAKLYLDHFGRIPK